MLVLAAILMAQRMGWFRFRQDYSTSPQPAATTAQPGEYLFCFWNTENFFDDQQDKRNHVDEEYDNWFARHPDDFRLKVTHLADILLQMNDGKGPDILAIVEVETIRAAEALRAELNGRLPAGAAPYGEVQMKEVSGGRHIAPALLGRVPAAGSPQLHGKGLRILEAHVTAANHDLEIVATHWTSQLTDKTGHGREHYAKEIYGEYTRRFRSDPGVDLLVCGDFNTEPSDEAVVQHLHAGADIDAVRIAHEPLLLDLFAGKNPANFGTHYYNKPLIYDQICVSSGLLDEKGWTCLTDTAQTWTQGMIRPGSTRRQPWRFGNERDSGGRGYSDHFPVTVKLKVQ
jgi:endonuclease/exonuclease/phosphatase family metal-dependent hydrolase